MHSYREEIGPHPISVAQRGPHRGPVLHTQHSAKRELILPAALFVLTCDNPLPVPVSSHYIRLDRTEAL